MDMMHRTYWSNTMGVGIMGGCGRKVRLAGNVATFAVVGAGGI